MHTMRRLSIIVALSLGNAASLAGQDVVGTLRHDISGQPAAGAVVVAERIADGQVVARTVTGASGTWRLRVSEDSLVVRALRVGFLPFVLDTVQLARGQRVDLSASLPDRRVELPAARTIAASRCEVRPDSASTAARVFHEARTALMASSLVHEVGPVRTRVRVTNEVWSADESKRLEIRHREFTSDSLRPFRTASVDSLLAHGFISRVRESVARGGMSFDAAVAYRAPSVELLMDDRFLSDYCLQLVTQQSARSDLIGVEFRPARKRRITQVTGTLWVDRRSAELRKLEFGYDGLEELEAQVNPGGWLEFMRLETGLWFVNRWEMRVPDVQQYLERQPRGGQLLVTWVKVPVLRARGEVLDVEMDARGVFTTGALDRVENGELVSMALPLDSLRSRCPGTAAAPVLFGTVRTTSGAPIPAARLTVFWRARDMSPDHWMSAEGTGDPQGRFALCGLESERGMIVEVRADDFEPAAIAVRIDPPREAARLDLVLSPGP